MQITKLELELVILFLRFVFHNIRPRKGLPICNRVWHPVLALEMCIPILSPNLAVLLAKVQGCGVYLFRDIAQLAMARAVLPLSLCLATWVLG